MFVKNRTVEFWYTLPYRQADTGCAWCWQGLVRLMHNAMFGECLEHVRMPRTCNITVERRQSNKFLSKNITWSSGFWFKISRRREQRKIEYVQRYFVGTSTLGVAALRIILWPSKASRLGITIILFCVEWYMHLSAWLHSGWTGPFNYDNFSLIGRNQWDHARQTMPCEFKRLVMIKCVDWKRAWYAWLHHTCNIWFAMCVPHGVTHSGYNQTLIGNAALIRNCFFQV